MPSVHLFHDLSPEERQQGKSRIMQVHFTTSETIIEQVFAWFWWAVGAGVSVVIVLIVLVALLLS